LLLCQTHLILLDLFTQIIFCKGFRSQSSSLSISLHSPCYLVPLRSKCLHHPILENPHPMFS
jgi:hypothetical protein